MSKQIKSQGSIHDEEIGNIIVKKRITETPSTQKKTIIKEIKNVKKDQEEILMSIENINIQNHVQEMLKNFNPPKCTKCENRTANRVCVNKTCSRNNFMQLICGKCHFIEHQNSIIKPEIDLEEFFIKLATFLNEQKYSKKKQNSNIKTYSEYLKKCLDNINTLRLSLNNLKEQLKIELQDYQRPEEMQNNLSNLLTNALSLCEYDNVQKQLNLIKNYVIFNGNQFTWNDYYEKQKNINKLIDKLENNTTDIYRSINKSVNASDNSIDLSNIEVIKSALFGCGDNCIQTKLIDNELFMTNDSGESQIYLNYKLNKLCKYKIRFRFEKQPKLYVMVGVIPLSRVNLPVCSFECGFCKIFLSPTPALDCSRVIKGQENRNLFNKGDQFEIRVDFQNYYMDVYDYPEMNNINANQLNNNILPDESYVIAVGMGGNQCIVLESIEEIDEIINYS